jgi:hypothetical protein
MSSDAQIRFLMHQIEVDRFLSDWQEYLAVTADPTPARGW